MLSIGDTVKCMTSRYLNVEEGRVYTVNSIKPRMKRIRLEEASYWYEACFFDLIETKQEQPTKGEEMNSTVAKLFEKTADAVLVEKYYADYICDNDVSYIMLSGKQKEILAAAQEKEVQENKSK